MTKEQSIAERLRQMDAHDTPAFAGPLMVEAADEIEALRRERHQLRNELTAARLESERLQKALKSVQNLAGGHPIECECRQCEIFELLEPIVGNTSPRNALEPNPGHSNLCACPACLQERGREAIDNALKPAPEPNPAQPDPRWALIAELTKWAADWAVYRGPAEKPVDKGWRLAAEEVQSMIQKSSEKSGGGQ